MRDKIINKSEQIGIIINLSKIDFITPTLHRNDVKGIQSLRSPHL
ncbi:MAG: hypothetical protein ACXABG_00360 [Promethearchaeota archaeon]